MQYFSYTILFVDQHSSSFCPEYCAGVLTALMYGANVYLSQYFCCFTNLGVLGRLKTLLNICHSLTSILKINPSRSGPPITVLRDTSPSKSRVHTLHLSHFPAQIPNTVCLKKVSCILILIFYICRLLRHSETQIWSRDFTKTCVLFSKRFLFSEKFIWSSDNQFHI